MTTTEFDQIFEELSAPQQVVTVTFHPQAWQNDYAIPVDPEGETEFQVSISDVEGLQDDTYESDDLRYHNNAPKWIREWTGPFYIEIERREF